MVSEPKGGKGGGGFGVAEYGFKEFLSWLQARAEAGLGGFQDGERIAGVGERVRDGEVGEEVGEFEEGGTGEDENLNCPICKDTGKVDQDQVNECGERYK